MVGKLGVTETAWPQDSVLVAGDFRAMKKEAIKSGEGELVRGTVLARDAATAKLVALDKEVAVENEVLAAASKTAADVTGEALVTDAGGTLKQFNVFTAYKGVEPGSVTIHATVGSAAKAATDAAGDGKLAGDFSGFIDYASGFVCLVFGTAPDDNTNVTADYTYGADQKTFASTLDHTPVIPRTITATATIGAAAVNATDDGHGKLSGTGVSGTIDYETGAVSLTYTTAPDDPSNVVVDYSYGDANQKHLPVALLVEDLDATSADAEAQVYLVGEYRQVDLVWPSGIGAGNKSRSLAQLQVLGIVTK